MSLRVVLGRLPTCQERAIRCGKQAACPGAAGANFQDPAGAPTSQLSTQPVDEQSPGRVVWKIGHFFRRQVIPAQRLFANAPGALLVPYKLPRARLEQINQSPLNDKARVAIGTMKTVLFAGKGTMTAAWTAQQLTQPRCLGGFTGRIQRLGKE